MDREFSYLNLLEWLNEEWVNYVIRLNHSRVDIKYKNGEKVDMHIEKWEYKYWEWVYYWWKHKLNVWAYWWKLYYEPIYIITNMDPKEWTKTYYQRMKIEQWIRDLKQTIWIEKNMNKTQERAEKLLVIWLIAAAIGVLIWEQLRLGFSNRTQKLYSGLFIFAKFSYNIPEKTINKALLQVLNIISSVFKPPA